MKWQTKGEAEVRANGDGLILTIQPGSEKAEAGIVLPPMAGDVDVSVDFRIIDWPKGQGDMPCLNLEMLKSPMREKINTGSYARRVFTNGPPFGWAAERTDTDAYVEDRYKGYTYKERDIRVGSLRLVRKGNRVTSSCRDEGKEWSDIGGYDVPYGDESFSQVRICHHNNQKFSGKVTVEIKSIYVNGQPISLAASKR